MNNLDVANLGQVFTRRHIVSDMIGLIKNSGSILEPSCGNGAFINCLKDRNIIGIEIDSRFINCGNILNIDFMDYDVINKFDTIIGNPPYVRYQNIISSTKKTIQNKYMGMFDCRSNLYLFFIYKSILHLKDGGELIFITPRDFLKSTSATKLNQFMYENGTITDLYEMGDKKIFDNATPNTIIWRYEKNNYSRLSNCLKNFTFGNGQLLFTKNKYSVKLSDIFDVKVGAVSGADKVFEHEDGIEFVCSYTNSKGKTKKLLYNQRHKDLEPYKDILINRRVRNFTEDNWWMWGRNYYQSNRARIYVNSKTRIKNPFFISNIEAYDGSILALFLKDQKYLNRLNHLCNMLNAVDWEDLGFVVDGRFIFSQRTLENINLPDEFGSFVA
jgi:adenine-specific DNA-methyltransferase